MKNYGIKISRKGYDVKTAPDDKLAFSSEYKGLRIALEGEEDLVAGSNHIVITHDLGYKPFSIVSATETSIFNKTITLPVSYASLGIYGFFGWYRASTTELIVDIFLEDETLEPQGEGKLKYYLFINEL
jgi:hypothetical protein